MEEWGGKYISKREAWETLKGMCASSDIQLQDVLEETEKEVMLELDTKADIVDEENAETSPLLANEEHNENSEKEILAISESDQLDSKESHIKGTQAEQEMIVLHKNTQGNIVYTKSRSKETV